MRLLKRINTWRESGFNSFSALSSKLSGPASFTWPGYPWQQARKKTCWMANRRVSHDLVAVGNGDKKWRWLATRFHFSSGFRPQALLAMRHASCLACFLLVTIVCLSFLVVKSTVVSWKTWSPRLQARAARMVLQIPAFLWSGRPSTWSLGMILLQPSVHAPNTIRIEGFVARCLEVDTRPRSYGWQRLHYQRRAGSERHPFAQS